MQEYETVSINGCTIGGSRLTWRTYLSQVAMMTMTTQKFQVMTRFGFDSLVFSSLTAFILVYHAKEVGRCLVEDAAHRIGHRRPSYQLDYCTLYPSFCPRCMVLVVLK